MEKRHKQIIEVIKKLVNKDTSLNLKISNQRFFEKEIKNGRGNWGYTPDLVLKKRNKIIIVEIEYGVNTSKIIEDLILANVIDNAIMFIMITEFGDYVERWKNLLEKKLKVKLNLKIIEDSKKMKPVSGIVNEFRKSLKTF